MNPVSAILSRSIATPFFRQYAGLFLFLFFILFGIYPYFYQVVAFHHTLIVGILTKPAELLIAAIIWFLYACSIFSFFYSCAENNQYLFLQNMNAISSRQRFFFLWLLIAKLFSPALFYGLVILVIAVIEKHIPGGLWVMIILIALHILVTLSCYLVLQKGKSFFLHFRKIAPGIHWPDNLFSFLLRYIFRKQFAAFAALKIVSFTCLYFFVSMNPISAQDRLLWFLFVTLMVGHSILIYKNHQFIETQLAFYRNMPVPVLASFLQLFAIYLVILIPEYWALKGIVLQFHALADYVFLSTAAPCLLLLMHSLLYTADLKMEDSLKMLFGLWVVYFFFGLSGLRWLLPVLTLILSYIIFQTSYYRYQKNADIDAVA